MGGGQSQYSQEYRSRTFYRVGAMASNMGQELWSDTNFLGFSEQTTNGLDSGVSAPYLGFDSNEFVQHSPLFGRMPPVPDSGTDGFDLGSSSAYYH